MMRSVEGRGKGGSLYEVMERLPALREVGRGHRRTLPTLRPIDGASPDATTGRVHLDAGHDRPAAAALRDTDERRAEAGEHRDVAAVFLGGIGAHHFYLGRTGTGVLYLLFCWTFIPAFIALIEAFGMRTRVTNDNTAKANEIARQIAALS